MGTTILTNNKGTTLLTNFNKANPMILEPSKSVILTEEKKQVDTIIGKTNVTTIDEPSSELPEGLIVNIDNSKIVEAPRKTTVIPVAKLTNTIIGQTNVTGTQSQGITEIKWKNSEDDVKFTKDPTEELKDGEFGYNSETGDLSLNGHTYKADITIPTKTSELENDNKFITQESVPSKVSELENDSKYITQESVPTKTSELENNSGFITSDDIPEEPTLSGTSGMTLGGLTKDKDLTGMTAKEVLEEILFPEYAPKWTDATASLTGGCTLEVGKTVPAKTTFTASGSTATAGSASGGTATDTISSTVAFGTQVTTRQAVTVSLSRVYAAGSDEVKTNKGNKTNKTASNATTLLSSVTTTNSNIDATTYKIKQITKTASQTVYFAWPIYIDDTAQTLSYSLTEYQKEKQVTATTSISFSCPTSYTSKTIYYYDSVARAWTNVTDECSSSTADKSINGVTKNYTTYTYSKVAGNRPYKITFTIA